MTRFRTFRPLLTTWFLLWAGLAAAQSATNPYQSYSQIFFSSSSGTIPANMKVCEVYLMSGGASGAGGGTVTTSGSGGASGGSGFFVDSGKFSIAAWIAQGGTLNYTVTVGAGGAASAAGAAGNPGGATTLTSGSITLTAGNQSVATREPVRQRQLEVPRGQVIIVLKPPALAQPAQAFLRVPGLISTPTELRAAALLLRGRRRVKFSMAEPVQAAPGAVSMPGPQWQGLPAIMRGRFLAPG